MTNPSFGCHLCGRKYRTVSSICSHITRTHNRFAHLTCTATQDATLTPAVMTRDASVPTIPTVESYTSSTQLDQAHDSDIAFLPSQSSSHVCFDVFNFFEYYKDSVLPFYPPSLRMRVPMSKLNDCLRQCVPYACKMNLSALKSEQFYKYTVQRDISTGVAPGQSLATDFPTHKSFHSYCSIFNKVAVAKDRW